MIGGAVAPPFLRISRMTSALGSRGQHAGEQDQVELGGPEGRSPASPSWASVTACPRGVEQATHPLDVARLVFDQKNLLRHELEPIVAGNGKSKGSDPDGGRRFPAFRLRTARPHIIPRDNADRRVPCPVTANGARSSTRRAPPTPSAAASSPSSSRRSRWPPSRAAARPNPIPRLRKAIDDAKAVNMPADNIKRAIQRGTGELPGVSYEEITFEGYGPGGAAILDRDADRQQEPDAAEIRTIFSKHGGNLGRVRLGPLPLPEEGLHRDREGQGERGRRDGGRHRGGRRRRRDDGPVPRDQDRARDASTPSRTQLESKGLPLAVAEISMIPTTEVALDQRKADQMVQADGSASRTTTTCRTSGRISTSRRRSGRHIVKILGLDPGSVATGFGIVVFEDGRLDPRGLRRLAAAAAPLRWRKSSTSSSRRASSCSDRCRPDAVSVETVFAAKNIASALKLAHARGVAAGGGRRAARSRSSSTSRASSRRRSSATGKPKRSRSGRWSCPCWPASAPASPSTPPTPWPSRSATSTRAPPRAADCARGR